MTPTDEGALLFILQQVPDQQLRVLLLQAYIAEYGPLSEATAIVVRELLQ